MSKRKKEEVTNNYIVWVERKLIVDKYKISAISKVLHFYWFLNIQL